MSYTVRAAVCAADQLARVVATLHQRNVRTTYMSYRESGDGAGGEAVVVVADEHAAQRACRALERVVTVSRVTVDAPADGAHVVKMPPRDVREANRVRDAFARVYR